MKSFKQFINEENKELHLILFNQGPFVKKIFSGNINQVYTFIDQYRENRDKVLLLSSLGKWNGHYEKWDKVKNDVTIDEKNNKLLRLGSGVPK